MNAETVTSEMLTPAPTTPAPEAVTPSIKDVPAVESAEQQIVTESDSNDATDQGEEKPKRDGGFQRRIKELVDERNQERAERQRERAENQRLSEQLQRTQQVPQSQTTQTSAGSEPKLENFDSYEKFLDARADWRADLKIKAMQEEGARQSLIAKQQAALQSQQQQLTDMSTKLNSMIEDGEKKHPDFFEKVFPGNGRAVPISEVVGQALLESDVGIDLMYYLSTNRAEAERIAKLSPTRQVAEIGKLEATLPKVQKSDAPKPISPINAKRQNANENPRDDDDMATWTKKEMARLKGKS